MAKMVHQPMNPVYEYSGIFSNKKGWSPDMLYNMDEPWKLYAE